MKIDNIINKYLNEENPLIKFIHKGLWKSQESYDDSDIFSRNNIIKIINNMMMVSDEKDTPRVTELLEKFKKLDALTYVQLRYIHNELSKLPSLRTRKAMERIYDL